MTRRPAPVTFAALVRGRDGSLQVAEFATAEDASAAAAATERLGFAPPSRDPWKYTGSPAELSKRMGGVPSAKTIWRLCRDGGLPAQDNGAGEVKARYRLPIRAIVASIAVRGLRATVAAHRAGQLIA